MRRKNSEMIKAMWSGQSDKIWFHAISEGRSRREIPANGLNVWEAGTWCLTFTVPSLTTRLSIHSQFPNTSECQIAGKERLVNLQLETCLYAKWNHRSHIYHKLIHILWSTAAVKFCSFLTQFKDMQFINRWPYSKLPLAVNGRLSLCVGPVVNMSRANPVSWLMPAGTCSSPPTILTRKSN